MCRGSWLLLLLLVSLLAREGYGNKTWYCDNPCTSKWGDEHIHTMCKYKRRTPSADCGKYKKYSRLNETARRVIVDVHNQLRDHVALGLQEDRTGEVMPSAADMLEMAWDEELAEIAQRWADRCILGQDLCRDVKRFVVAQNAAVSIHDLKSDKKLKIYIPKEIHFWFNKVQEFSFSDQNKIDLLQILGKWTPTTQQFTNIAWARTSLVGCGRAVFERDAKLHELLVCNYGPADHVFDAVVYVEGEPCSFCPEGMSCSREYEALCSVNGTGTKGKGGKINVRTVQEQDKIKKHRRKSVGFRPSPTGTVFCACVLCALAIF